MINFLKLTFEDEEMTAMRVAKNAMNLGFSAGAMLALAFVATQPAHAVDLAKVNGRVISDRDLQSALNNLNDGQRQNVLKDSNSRRQVLTSVIDQELLVQ